MGMCPSKSGSGSRSRSCRKSDQMKMLLQKIRLLQQEVSLLAHQREEESKAYEREVMAFALKESDWKKERKRLREEVKRLQRDLEEREMLLFRGDHDNEDEDEDEEEQKEKEKEKVAVAEEPQKKDLMTMMKMEMVLSGQSRGGGGGHQGGRALDSIAAEFLVEQMREERARRDEAVEKWKMLYLAIKNELDDLIQRTHQGGALAWRPQEDELMIEIQSELKAKDETIEVLKTQIASMEQEEYRRKRELDILRQSLRIMTSKKKSTSKYTC